MRVVNVIAGLAISLVAIAGTAAFRRDAPVKTIIPTGVRWRIDRPIVNQPEAAYPEIVFRQGDRVTVRAGGCVQTGGTGETWKHYVNPQGPNADRLYRGLIHIPLVTSSYVPIGAVVDKTLRVGAACRRFSPDQMHLRIGYVDGRTGTIFDILKQVVGIGGLITGNWGLFLASRFTPTEIGDIWGDNGYDERDDSPQCLGEPDAFIEITIEPDESPVTPVPSGADLDLFASCFDENGLFENPQWNVQARSPQARVIPDAMNVCGSFINTGDSLQLGTPPCTTQSPTVDEPSFFDNPTAYLVCHAPFGLSVHGHVNWSIVRYDGTIFFQDWQVPVIPAGPVGDNDYDFLLVRDESGLTTGNREKPHSDLAAMALEFNGDETVHQFTSEWWSVFRDKVWSHALDRDWRHAAAHVNGKRAVAIGLMGLDVQHDAQSELHPVYGLAIHSHNTANTQVWQFFVRNWGNEGFCSQDQHYFRGRQIELFLPAEDGDPASMEFVGASITRNNPNVAWDYEKVTGGGVLIVRLPAPEDRALISGELRLSKSPTARVNADEIQAREEMMTELGLFRTPDRDQPQEGSGDSGAFVAALNASARGEFARRWVKSYRSLPTRAARAAQPAPRDDSLRPTRPPEGNAPTRAAAEIDAIGQQWAKALESTLSAVVGDRMAFYREITAPAGTALTAAKLPAVLGHQTLEGRIESIERNQLTVAPAGGGPVSIDVYDVDITRLSAAKIAGNPRRAFGSGARTLRQVLDIGERVQVTFIDLGWTRRAVRISVLQ
jgi:hypothetical protein